MLRNLFLNRVYFDTQDEFAYRMTKSYFERNGFTFTTEVKEADIYIVQRTIFDEKELDRVKACRRLSMHKPILCFSHGSSEQQILALYHAGADQHETYPINVEEMTLRAKVFLKRSRIRMEKEEIRLGECILRDMEFVRPDGITLSVPPRQHEILRYFFKNAGRVCYRNEAIRAIYGEDGNYFSGRTIDTYICHIRKHIAGTGLKLESLHGKGWLFSTI